MNAASWLEGLPAHDRWRSLLMSEGPRIATWVLGAALGIQLAFIVLDLGGGRHAAPVVSPHPMVPRHALDVAAITGAHLFGVPPAAKQDGANAPQTTIPLVLTGTIAGNDPQNGLAILGQTAQNAKVYAVGDNVPGGAKLHSVYSDRVVIDRDGQLESLALPHQTTTMAPAPTTAAFGGGESNSIERMRRMISERPGLLADVMHPQPVMDHGKMNGFRVYPGRNRMAFMRLGLRPGDQVTAINGTPLDDRDRGEQILQTLSSSSEAHVTVMRNGQQQDLTLNIAQVAQEADSLATQGPAAQFGAVPPVDQAVAAPPPPEPPGPENGGQ
jgi:general secretion pathway protein C